MQLFLLLHCAAMTVNVNISVPAVEVPGHQQSANISPPLRTVATLGKAIGDDLRLNVLRLLRTESLGVLELTHGLLIQALFEAIDETPLAAVHQERLHEVRLSRAELSRAFFHGMPKLSSTIKSRLLSMNSMPVRFWR